MTYSGRIRSILVCGGGVVGLSAALAFARALPSARVQLLDLPLDPAALADRLPGTLPSIRHFNQLVGMSEGELVRAAAATHRLATRLDGWGGDEPWYHAYGRHGVQMQSSPFPHQWARLRQDGKDRAYDRYAPAAALARAGKFVHPVEDQGSPLASFDYGLRLDPELYRALLLHHAVQARVRVQEGAIAAVHTAEARVHSVSLRDGSQIEADLFIDCAGPSAPLLSRLENNFADWAGELPTDRLIMGVGSAVPPTPLDIVTATDLGWKFAFPLLSRTMLGFAYSSAFTNDAEARQSLASDGGTYDTETVVLRAGARPETWVGNVVAFGDSAVAIDPLECTNLTLAQSAIRRAISLLPDADFHPLLLREFNRRTKLEVERVRDFIALHYLAASKRTGAFWASMATRQRPPGLVHTLEQFEGRGRLPKFEEDSFTDDSWFAVLFGLGLMPREIDRTAFRVDAHESAATMDRVAQLSSGLPAGLPRYDNYLGQLTYMAGQ